MFSLDVLMKPCFTYKHYYASVKTVESKWAKERAHNVMMC